MQPNPKPANDDSEPDELGKDLLIGAKAIGAELGWSERKVYHMSEEPSFPIHTVKGIGVCARKSTLREFFDQLDAQCLNPVEGQDDQG